MDPGREGLELHNRALHLRRSSLGVLEAQLQIVVCTAQGELCPLLLFRQFAHSDRDRGVVARQSRQLCRAHLEVIEHTAQPLVAVGAGMRLCKATAGQEMRDTKPATSTFHFSDSQHDAVHDEAVVDVVHRHAQHGLAGVGRPIVVGDGERVDGGQQQRTNLKETHSCVSQ